MRQRYWGFTDAADINNNFSGYVDEPKEFVKDEEIVVAIYDTGNYQGHALVIFERDGKLYEVNGSHCSCFGLEDQWTPEETSWKALAIRKFDSYDFDNTDGALAALQELIKSNADEA